MDNKKLPYDCIALVLQGGGALGAYQAGVFEGLCEAGIDCDWVAGISIGAINAALIVGNPPKRRVERLREFWTTVTAPPLLPATPPLAPSLAAWDNARTALGWFDATRALVEGQRGFFVPRVPPPLLPAPTEAERLSWYDTAPLKDTLERLVDFERLNHRDSPRLTVSAVEVESGNYELFDNRDGPWAGRIDARHIMASGALPPGFAAVPIGPRHYWDGGLVSNTPLSAVLDAEPRMDTLAFQVDLWSAKGPLPRNLFDVEERQKDIRFSSRTRAVTAQLARERHLRRVLREVLQRVPTAKRGDDWCREAHALASDKRFNVVHLIYKEKFWDAQHKDFEFSAASMRDHWASGLQDLRATLAHPDWLAMPAHMQTTVTHDVHRNGHTMAPSRKRRRTP